LNRKAVDTREFLKRKIVSMTEFLKRKSKQRL
jgi:hypothetical protein